MQPLQLMHRSIYGASHQALLPPKPVPFLLFSLIREEFATPQIL